MPFSLTRTSFTTGTILICAATAAVSMHSGPAVVPEAMREALRAITGSLALMAVSIAFAAVLRSLLRRWKLPPLIPALAVVAAWASFLLAPGTASASVLSGSAPHGSLLGLLGAALAFGIAVATPPIAPTPGVETTEYKIHKWVMIVGGALTAGLAICSQLQMFAPTGSKLSGYLTLAASIGAAALLVLKAAGYEDSRTDQKTEAFKAQAAVETAKATAAAGANAGTATAALATDLK